MSFSFRPGFRQPVPLRPTIGWKMPPGNGNGRTQAKRCMRLQPSNKALKLTKGAEGRAPRHSASLQRSSVPRSTFFTNVPSQLNAVFDGRRGGNNGVKAAAILLCVFLIAGSSAASEPVKCQLPAADARDGASPPNLSGTIASVGKKSFTVRPSSTKSGRVYRLHHDRSTAMFTVFGGAVDSNQLRSGQRVHVWFQGCRAASSGRTLAAVVQLASTTPGEDFP
jgi:hypothetical protein